MAILVIGGTGQIGSLIVKELATRNVRATALGHRSGGADLPSDVDVIKGDVLDVDFMRKILRDFSTVFLLNPVVPDELTRALLVLGLAADAGIERFVYFSMINSDMFSDTPHAAAKYATEQAIGKLKMPASILRPNYFFQNDVNQETPLKRKGIYAMPIDGIGVTMVDTLDIAATAALELIRREQSSRPLPTEVIEIVGPDLLTGDSIAGLWSDVLDMSISYAGDDLRPFEEVYRKQGSSGRGVRQCADVPRLPARRHGRVARRCRPPRSSARPSAAYLPRFRRSPGCRVEKPRSHQKLRRSLAGTL